MSRAGSVDEVDAGAAMGEAIIHASPAASVPIEVHLGDQEPAAGIDRLDVRDVSGAPGALDAWPEHNGRVHCGLYADAIAARGGARRPVFRVADVGEVLIAARVLRPPGTLAKGPPIVAVRR